MRTLSLLMLLVGAASGQRFTSVFIDIPQANSPVIGVITVAGWAIDNTTSIGWPITLVQVAIDGTPQVVATYGVYRPDVCAAYPGRPGCPYVGFTAQLNTASITVNDPNGGPPITQPLPPGPHTLDVYATNSNGDGGVTHIPILVASSLSAATTDTTSTSGSPGDTVTDDSTGGTMSLPTKNAPLPRLLLTTSQESSGISNRAVSQTDTYTKTIMFAPPNSPVYMLGSAYDVTRSSKDPIQDLNAAPVLLCITPGSSYFSSAPCQVGTTDANGSFSISGSFGNLPLITAVLAVNEQWWVGGTDPANLIDTLGYMIFSTLPSPPQ